MFAVTQAVRSAVRLAAKPTVLSLESTNRCNATCVMCARGKLTRPPRTMDFDLFARAVAEAKAAGIQVFQLSFYGECLLDPRLGDKIRHLKREIPAAWVQIVTNGALLTPQKSRELLESGLSLIRISVDGNGAAEYEAIRPHLSYAVLVENVRALRALRDANPAFSTVLTVAGLHLKAYPLDEAAFRAFWGALVDKVYVRNEHDLDRAGPESLLQKVVPCHKLFTQLPVLADGRHTACVFDWYGEAVCGDFARHGLRGAWFSRRRTWYKALHLLGLKKTIPLCRGCSYRPPVMGYVKGIRQLVP
jgi:hypothetical protein